MAKYVVAIIAVLLLVAGVYAFNSTKKNTSGQPSMSSQNGPSTAVKDIPSDSVNGDKKTSQTVVSYGDSGFSPKSVDIKVGETVIFKNDSSGQMWVASAPHPMHTDYPAFDAKKNYAPGESYSFTFDKPGNWKYHNHMNPAHFGVVNVQ